jgi:hypothetical protein
MTKSTTVEVPEKEATIIPSHQWTNGGGEVFVLRFCGHDGSSYNGFKHPIKVGETVTAPDWKNTDACGNGIHGWPWGLSIGEGKEADWGALWQVYGVNPKEIAGNLEGGGKCKFRIGVLRFIGDWHAAMLFVLDGQIAWVQHAASGAASATGYRGAASATGYRGAASATGDSGAASATGDSGAASATGDGGAASATGDSGAASATGDRGAASAKGKCTLAAVTGAFGRARAGEFGCIALGWWNAKLERMEMRCALIGTGKGQLKPDTWYRLDDTTGEFVECENQ